MTDQPVREQDVQPGRPGRCGYCPAKLGEQHAADCVCRVRTVVVEFKIEYEVEVPDFWDEREINFHRNGGSWCASNVVEELEALGCLCGRAEFRYVREA